MIERACRERKPLSVGLLGNAAEVLPELVHRGVRPDAVTDQTSAHDPINGYLPAGLDCSPNGKRRRTRDPMGVAQRGEGVHGHPRARHVGILAAQRSHLRLWQQYPPDGEGEGVENAFDFPGFVPAYIRPLFCRGVGPFRWVALSGDPEDISRTDAKVKELMPHDRHLHNWLDMAQSRIKFQGLPARICWVGLGDRHRLGLLQRHGGARRSRGPDRDRPRSPGFGFGREP